MGVQWFDRETLAKVVRFYVRETDVVLDIGCGIKPQEFFKPRLHILCEPCQEYVSVLRQKFPDSPDRFILMSTAEDLVRLLPDRSVDTVFLLDIIEHLEKGEGKNLLSECERVARHQVILFTPLGFVAQEHQPGGRDAWGLRGGAWQVHVSGWEPQDFDSSWEILGAQEYHLTDAMGHPLIPPAGAFWAIKTMRAAQQGSCAEMEVPRVSIVTPTYNRANYLEETIQSVITQDYPRIEYIVLDDGSTDNTRSVLEKYTGRIIWESHPNMGEARTVNKGVAMAHGDILMVVNSDDPLLPGAVSSAVELLQGNPDVLVAYPDWDYIDAGSKVVGHIQVPEHDYLFMLCHHHCSVGPGAAIRRTGFHAVGGRDPEFRFVSDFDFWLRLGLHGRFKRIPRTLATFRVHQESASVGGRGRKMAEEHIRLIRKYYALPNLPREVLRVRRRAFAWAYYIAGVTAGEDVSTARRCYARALLYHPWSLRVRWKHMAWATAPRWTKNLLAAGWLRSALLRAVCRRCVAEVLRVRWVLCRGSRQAGNGPRPGGK